MAATHFSFLLFCLLFLFILHLPGITKASSGPKALVLPVSKDPSTLQYLTCIHQRTPLVPVKLTLDLGGEHLSVECDHDFISYSYKPVPCDRTHCRFEGDSRTCISKCISGRRQRPGCYDNACALYTDNTIAGDISVDEVGEDVVSIRSTDGTNPGGFVSIPKFIFTCSVHGVVLEGLATGVKGMAGFGRSNISIPSQSSAAFGFDRKFAICLSSSTTSDGVLVLGDGPYVFLPNIDVSKSLIYTPLIFNPFNTASVFLSDKPSTDYFIGVTSIKINDKTVGFNSSLLSIDDEGYGGTKISTVNPYTVMETSIYKAVTTAFLMELADVPIVEPVPPFGVCFNSTDIGMTRVGPAVPQIDFVLQNKSVFWRMFGANSIVQVKSDVVCLGFVDGGVRPRTSIVLGGYQLEDNLLQFDLENSRLGFSSSLLIRRTTCANFNFTSNASKRVFTVWCFCAVSFILSVLLVAS